MYKQLAQLTPIVDKTNFRNTNYGALANVFSGVPQTVGMDSRSMNATSNATSMDSNTQGGTQINITTDPLTYCLLDSFDSQMLNGPTGKQNGKYSKNCSQFLSNRCAIEWDSICESVSIDPNTNYPNTAQQLSNTSQLSKLSYGDNLVRDSAFKRFKSNSFNCNLQCVPFDPLVIDSPLVCYETPSANAIGPSQSVLHFGDVNNGTCVSTYEITADQAANLNQDIIMNKLLRLPWIAPDLLDIIFNTMKNKGTLPLLKNTYLGSYYEQTYGVKINS